MAYTLAVADRLTELCSARPFSDFLNWVAAQPGATDGAYDTVLAVRPIEYTYVPEEVETNEEQADLWKLVGELEQLSKMPSHRGLGFVLELWLREANRALSAGIALEFV